jgi:hypothetical protein
MTQNPFDAFSKEFLADLLEPFGTVERSFEVPGESKYIDLLFLPIGSTTKAKSKVTGSLKKVISTPSVLEIYSGSPTEDEVFTENLGLKPRPSRATFKIYSRNYRHLIVNLLS